VVTALDARDRLRPHAFGLLAMAAHCPQGEAAFVGALIGSSIGLVALLLGALFNAELNRRRDDRLRREDRRAVATALRAELERASPYAQ
jgi:hypothetical protein